ncbi:ABC transporter ATP-binding protein [Puia sp.]|jgi:lipopolysaccharide transport system ATP-binding protein|uniref:ABC transporter ATP-binding protein n=1 Tax=Puia sp. TaxID=2045100 RepID=UPI002F40D603
MSVAIKVEHLSKAYQLGVIGTGTLSRDIERWIAKKRGKADPFLRIGEINDRTVAGGSDIVWSLRDISLEISQGEAVGIIGRNGAGKSTLLKLLSRVTAPTSGSIRIRGRIASLLEVGTGFHPELTGRENIYLNGAILGMRRKEIDRKLDEIIDFSGVEKYIDTPVKRYSSGMYVRLAFAVAAHLESEILIVDEVLAVGDAEFQKKCLGKVKEVATGGRTVLFVSHNMAAIQQLCTSVVCLKNGMVEFQGNVQDGMQVYFSSMRAGREMQEVALQKRRTGNKKAYVAGFEVKLAEEGRRLMIGVAVEASAEIEKTEIAVGINDGLGIRLITLHSRFTAQQFVLKPGTNWLVCTVENFFLRPGTYTLDVSLGSKFDTLDYLDEPLEFEVPEYSLYPTSVKPEGSQGYLMASHRWANH